jgi:hypothetical protein
LRPLLDRLAAARLLARVRGYRLRAGRKGTAAIRRRTFKINGLTCAGCCAALLALRPIALRLRRMKSLPWTISLAGFAPDTPDAPDEKH